MKRFSVEAFKKHYKGDVDYALHQGWPQFAEGTALEDFEYKTSGLNEKCFRDNQSLDILRYLKSGFHITTASATSLFSCYRLSERIRDIEAMGYVVERKSLKTGKSGGQPTEYWLSIKKIKLKMKNEKMKQQNKMVK